MIGTDHKISFSDILMLPFSRSTLPPKIIQLRKVSQENHVRRMKIAHQRKQMQPPSDASMNLTSCVPGRNSSSFQTPFTTLKSRLDASDAGYSHPFDKNRSSPSTGNRNNFSPKIVDPSIRRRDCHSKFTDLKRTENSFVFNKRNAQSDTTIAYRESVSGKYLSDLKDKRQTITAGNNNCQRERDVTKLKTSCDKLDNTTLRLSQKNISKLNDTDNLNRNILNKNGDRAESRDYGDMNKSFQDKHNAGRKLKHSISKIPISLTRIQCKKESSTNHLPLSDSSHKSPQKGKTSTSKFQIEVVIRNSKETSEKDIPKSQKKVMNAENDNRSLNDSSAGCFSRDLKHVTLNTGCDYNCGRDVRNKERELLSNPLSSVSDWLNENVYPESNKNASVSRLLSHEDSNSIKGHRKVFQMNLNTKSSKISDITGLKSKKRQNEILDNGSSDTDPSVEYYYDTETGNDTATQDEDKNEWREDSDDEDSMVTIPTCKSSDILKKFTSQQLINDPDYPKTPYDLRYPRYKSKDSDNVKKYAETPKARMKTPKSRSRKKSLKSTPRRKKGNKSKKNLNFKKQDGEKWKIRRFYGKSDIRQSINSQGVTKYSYATQNGRWRLFRNVSESNSSKYAAVTERNYCWQNMKSCQEEKYDDSNNNSKNKSSFKRIYEQDTSELSKIMKRDILTRASPWISTTQRDFYGKRHSKLTGDEKNTALVIKESKPDDMDKLLCAVTQVPLVRMVCYNKKNLVSTYDNDFRDPNPEIFKSLQTYEDDFDWSGKDKKSAIPFGSKTWTTSYRYDYGQIPKAKSSHPTVIPDDDFQWEPLNKSDWSTTYQDYGFSKQRNLITTIPYPKVPEASDSKNLKIQITTEVGRLLKY